MPGNSASQKLNTPGGPARRSEKRQGPGATAMTQSEHGTGSGDKATKFTIEPRSKEPTAVPETL